MSVKDSFRDRIIFLREHSGAKTDKIFAKMTGISVENFQSYKRGSTPSIEKLSDILNNIEGLSAEWLVFGKGEPFPKENEESINTGTSAVNFDRDEFIEMKAKYDFMTKEYDYLKNELSKTTETNRNLSAVINEKNIAGSA